MQSFNYESQVRSHPFCATTTPGDCAMSVQWDKTLPAAVLVVPSSAFSSFLTFSIARIDSGMPGRELGGKASEVEEKRLCVSSVPPRVCRKTRRKIR